MGESAPANASDSLKKGLRRIAGSPLAASLLCMFALSASVWGKGSTYIDDVSSTLMGIRQLVAGDAEHYVAIAHTLREGDLRMAHVEPTGGADKGHRQPGFPALLALAGNLGVQGAPDLARVNLGLVVASLWIAFLGVRLGTGSTLAALLAAAVIYDAPFLFQIATQRLLAEPLYVTIAVAAVSTCVSYLRKPGLVPLLLTAVFASAAYLVRVNGLFLAVSLGTTIVLADLMRARRQDPTALPRDLTWHLPVGAYGVALLLLVVVAIPSWLPRTFYAGNPIYHGYLPNYLWVDTYDRAHVPGPPTYSLSTYVEEHDAGDALERLNYGVRRVFWDTPRDKLGTVSCVAVGTALILIVALRDRVGLLLLWAGTLQALPLVWTALPNPSRRIPAAALLPFAALLVATAAAALLRRVRSPGPDKA